LSNTKLSHNYKLYSQPPYPTLITQYNIHKHIIWHLFKRGI